MHALLSRRGLALSAALSLAVASLLVASAPTAKASPLDWTTCVNGTSDGGWCSIENLAHDLCLDAVASTDGTNGDQVQLYRCPYVGIPIAQEESELWTVLQSSYNGIPAGSVVNFAHDLCLDANYAGDPNNGDKVELWKCNSGSNQGWGIDVPIGTNQIENDAHFLCLDANAIHDGSSGDKVQLWHCTGGSNQHWVTGP
jgi:hypothetical protein